MWQRLSEDRTRGFLMLGVAQEAQGPKRVGQVVRELGIRFPVLVDRESVLARELEFRIVPSGFFVDDGIVRYSHTDDFDIGDPRVRKNLIAFLDGQPMASTPRREEANRQALDLFASGVDLYGRGEVARALRAWRQALAIDPSNFLIRSQIWVAEHPEHFYPVVDRAWQARQLIEEGYEQPLP